VRKRWWILLGLLAVGGGVISQLPLSWVGPKVEMGGKIPSYSGTIWDGTMSGTDAGVLQINSSLKRLFTGGNPVHVQGGSAGLNIHAEAGPSGLRALKAEGPMKALALRDPRLSFVNGSFKVDVPNAKILKRCEHAEGTVWTDFLAKNGARLRWTGPELSGPVTCEDGKIVLNMTGKDRAADIKANIIIDLEGTYITDINAQVTDPNAGLALQFFGFSQSGSGYQLTEKGRW